jgi:hypothetical protein
MSDYESAMMDFERRDLQRHPAFRDAPQWVLDEVLEYRSLSPEDMEKRDREMNEASRQHNARLETRSLPFEDIIEQRIPPKRIQRRY